MDIISRLTLALVLGFASFASQAYGTVPAVTGGTETRWRCDGHGFNFTALTPQAACEPFYNSTAFGQTPDACNGQIRQTTQTRTLVLVSQTATQANFNIRDQIVVTDGSVCGPFPYDAVVGTKLAFGNAEQVSGCPANSSSSGGSCLCAAGYKPNGASCQAITALDCALVASGLEDQAVKTTAFSTGFCKSGCQIYGQVGTRKGGDFWVYGPFLADADAVTCTADPVTGSNATTPGDAPPAGKCVGTVNGNTVYVPCDATKTATVSESVATSASGVTSTKTSSSTTCTGASCTTESTAVTTYPDGTTSTETTKEVAPKDSVDEPGKEEDPSTFGGSCAGAAASISCTGDAVQCAIAREQFKRNCEVFDSSNPNAQRAVEAIADGTSGDDDHPARSANTRILEFDQTDIAPGACPGDRVIGVGKTQVTIPFSQLCTAVGWLSNLLVGLTSLACMGIVFKQT